MSRNSTFTVPPAPPRPSQTINPGGGGGNGGNGGNSNNGLGGGGNNNTFTDEDDDFYNGGGLGGGRNGSRGGMSAQTKTGIAVGVTVLLLLLVTAGVGYWLYLRRKKEREFERQMDEQEQERRRVSSSVGGGYTPSSSGGGGDAEKLAMVGGGAGATRYDIQPTPPPPPTTGSTVPVPAHQQTATSALGNTVIPMAGPSGNVPVVEIPPPSHPSHGHGPFAAAGLLTTPSSLQKDDETMVRTLRALDKRITSHILTFYLPRPHDGHHPHGTSPRIPIPHESLLYFRSQVDGFDRYLNTEDTRVYVIRAILNAIILGSVAQGVFFTDSHPPGGLLRRRPVPPNSGADEYHHSRELAIQQLAANAQGNLRPLANDNTRQGEEARLLALQKTVRLVADYAGMIEAKEGVYEFVWGGSATEHEPMRPAASPFQKEEMVAEKVVELGQGGVYSNRERMVRAVVFPGLQRREPRTGRKVLLAKVHVMVA